MINKIYKNIHIKYSRFFKFVFFLRYIFAIFLFFFILFLTLPNFFDYKKREEILKNYLLTSYNLKAKELTNIKFNSFPYPNIQINNLNLELDDIKLKVSEIYIYPEIYNIYNYKNFKAKKIKLSNSKISLNLKGLKDIYSYIYNNNNKIIFDNLNLEIEDKKVVVLNIKNINYKNFKHEKNTLTGEIFGKKFKIRTENENQNIRFKFPAIGSFIEINLNEKKKDFLLNGDFKGKILKSNFKSDFNLNENSLKIDNSFFRSKDLSFSTNGEFKFKPFFSQSTITKLKDLNPEIFNFIDLNKVLNFKTFIRKLNGSNVFLYKAKGFKTGFIKNLNLSVNFAYGRMTFSKKIYLSGGITNCTGNLNLIEDNPILNFKCVLNSDDKKKFLKNFSINSKKKGEAINLNVQGNLNILNNKINFKTIEMNKEYVASSEDLKYFKENFEKNLLDKSFIGIFKNEKIKNFILEIS